MAYPLNETFATGLPAGFATLGGAGGITPTWKEAEQAVDLVFTQNQNFWKIVAAPMSTDFWIEMDVEILAHVTSPPHFGFWFWTGVERYEGQRVAVWQGNWVRNRWEANGSETSNVHIEPAEWAAAGERRTVRIDVRRHALATWTFQLSLDGVILWRGYERYFDAFLPCVFGYGITLRLHGIAGDAPSALPDPPTEVTSRLLPPILGHRILDLTTAQATHYNPRGFTKLLGFRNHYYHGNHRITGTVKEKAVPNDRPVSRRVFLFDECRHVLVRETWSDPVTGEYCFDEINPEPRYVVVAYDYKHNFRAVIADNLRAEPMPP